MTAETEHASGMLTRAEFIDMVELLRQLSRSRSVDIRRNTIVAWQLLITRTADAQLQRDAVRHLIETALTQEDKADGDVQVRSVAAERLLMLDPSLIAHAVRTLRKEVAMRNADRARRAAELAIVLLARRPVEGARSRVAGWALMGRAYLSLLALTLGQWFMTLRDGIFYLALFAFLLALLLPLAVEPLGLTASVFMNDVGTDAGIWVLLIAALSAIVAVPSSTLRGMARWLDAGSVTLLVMLGIILLSALEASGIGSEPGLAPTLPALPFLALGIFAARLANHVLSAEPVAGRIAGAAFGGWLVGSGSALLPYLTLMPSGEHGYWLFILVLIASCMIGSAWADYRRGASYVRAVPTPRTRLWRATTWALAGLSAVGMIATVPQMEARVQDAWNEAIAPAVNQAGAPFAQLDCQKGGRIEIPNIQLHRYYRVDVCSSRKVSLGIPYLIDRAEDGEEYLRGPSVAVLAGEPGVELDSQTRDDDGKVYFTDLVYSEKRSRLEPLYICLECGGLNSGLEVEGLISVTGDAWTGLSGAKVFEENGFDFAVQDAAVVDGAPLERTPEPPAERHYSLIIEVR